MKALNNYAQNMASTNYQQVYNNAFQNYLQNYSQFQQNQANQYNRLMGLTGIGQQATSALGNAQLGVAGNIGNILTGSSGAIAGMLGAQGQARATGTMGAANAYGGMIGGLGSAASSLPWGTWFPGNTTSKAVGSLSDYNLPNLTSSIYNTYPAAAPVSTPTTIASGSILGTGY